MDQGAAFGGSDLAAPTEANRAPLVANLAAAIFILPFFLFSATAGQLADKYDKAALIRFIKNLEIAIMLVIGAGFVWQVVALLFAGVFLMGAAAPDDDPYNANRPMLPASLPAALDALEREPLFRAQLGEVFVDYFLKLKRNEASRFAQWRKDVGSPEGDEPTEWEQNEYFDFF